MAKSKRSKPSTDPVPPAAELEAPEPPKDAGSGSDELVARADATAPPAALAGTPLPPAPDPLPLPAREIASPVQALVPVVRTPQLLATRHDAAPKALASAASRQPSSLADQIISVCAIPLVLVLGMLSLPGQWLGNGSSTRRR